MESPLRRARARPALLLAASIAAAPAAAAPRPTAPDACRPATGDALVALAAVTDDGDVVLADGRTLRLAGLDLPRATPNSPAWPARAGAALLAWAAAAPVTLKVLSPAPDRWSRIPVLLFRAGATPFEAGEALLDAGLARVAPEPAAHACLEGRLATEGAARAGARGVWADPRYAVLPAADAGGLAAQAGGLALVEGVLHLHENRGAFYLALGRDRHGFAAVVSRRDAKLFARNGLDLRDYENTPVRLRGDLDARFGPRMRLTDPDAVESLEPGSLVEPPPAPGNPRPKHWTAGREPR